MKKLLFLSGLLVAALLGAQNPIYQRVQIDKGCERIRELSQLGIDLDHSHKEGKDIVVEISQHETNLLNQQKIPYKILVGNLPEFYRQRAEANLASKMLNTVPCNPPNVKTPQHFHLGTYAGFFTLQEMIQQLDSMALLYPNLVKTKSPISATQSYESRDIWYVKISDNPNQDENEPEVLYTAVHHAREPASLSQLIFYMWYLLDNYATDPEVQAIVNKTELFFVPCLNPDGYVYNQTTSPFGGGMWRKNRRLNNDNTYGVDLNRNYGYNWGYDNLGSSPTTTSEVYRGAAAFSEPETQAIQDFCNGRFFVNALNAHTFGNHLIQPWGYLPATLTPDSILLADWGDYLAREHRYYWGTSDQTVAYQVNGSSDDWMYGEHTTKSKILAMTPESGSYNDGFWPVPSRITDICKMNLFQNLKLALMSSAHAKCFDEQDHFMNPLGYLQFRLKAYGMNPGNYTVSLGGVAGSLGSAGAAKIYTLLPGQELLDSISYVLSPGFSSGQSVKYALDLYDGQYHKIDTVVKVFGAPTVLLQQDGSSMLGLNTDVSWGTNTSVFHSPPSCFSDSPGGPYNSGVSNSLYTTATYNLAGAIHAHLQFFLRFEIEKSYDDFQLQVSIDGGSTYSPLCAKYTTPTQTNDMPWPLYDGVQKKWVKEEVDLDAYLGANVKLRFVMTSDGWDDRDGVDIDDILLRKLSTVNVNLSEKIQAGSFSAYPNPFENNFRIANPEHLSGKYEVFDVLGRQVSTGELNDAFTDVELKGSFRGLFVLRISDHPGQVYNLKLLKSE